MFNCPGSEEAQLLYSSEQYSPETIRKKQPFRRRRKRSASSYERKRKAANERERRRMWR
ncbi:unnamed protein product [Gongylonema pulchrum]|uniref:BZIP domain-containing protein n=1 Tax=Gongylonema pulchrum TaxID=637853 RepID=A0A183ER07_9BILA|nr:unnamed protein product [Gongylonema pulchrum]